MDQAPMDPDGGTQALAAGEAAISWSQEQLGVGRPNLVPMGLSAKILTPPYRSIYLQIYLIYKN